MTKIIDPTVSFHDGDHGSLIIEQSQVLSQEFLDGLKQTRADQDAKGKIGDWLHVASIPTVIVEKWLREGFDIEREPIAKTVGRLKSEGLDTFVVTSKNV